MRHRQPLSGLRLVNYFRVRPMKWILISMLCLFASGCGVVAAPCRIASAAIKIVPVVGDVAAAPTDACAEVID